MSDGRRAISTPAALILALAVLLAVPAASRAAPGDFDPSFSGDGKQVTDFRGSEIAEDVAVRPDGRIVVVGTRDTETGDGRLTSRLVIARYLPNGELDPSFSDDGKLVDDYGPGQFHNAGQALALEPDGRGIVVAGYAGTDDACDAGGCDMEIAVARYEADGDPEDDFSSDGKQVLDPDPARGDGDDRVRALAIQPNGAIVIGGLTDAASGGGDGRDFYLERLLPNGRLDPAFDAAVPTLRGESELINDLVLQPDGRIVAGGFASDGAGDTDFALVRYQVDGDLDPDFAGGGVKLTDLGTEDDNVTGVAIRSDGVIVAGGEAGDRSQRDFALARYLPDGRLDGSLGGDGTLVSDIGGIATANDLALQPGGRIVLAGAAFEPLDFALARYLPGGGLDASFSGDGVQRTDLGQDDFARAVAIQRDGKIVLAGAIGTASRDFALARYDGSTPSAPSVPPQTPPAAPQPPAPPAPQPPPAADATVPCPPGTSPSVTCTRDGKGRLSYRGTEADETFVGTRKDDRMRGGGGPDEMRARAGDDRLTGAGGKDELKAGAGKDKLSGNGGKDKLKGNGGKDRLAGGGGRDRLRGGAGKDELKGNGGKDRLSGDEAQDSLSGGGGNDRIDASGQRRERVRCGGGKRDRVTGARGDRVRRSCERVQR